MPVSLYLWVSTCKGLVERGHAPNSLGLFATTGVPVAGFVDEARVNLFGLETRVFVTEMKTVGVQDRHHGDTHLHTRRTDKKTKPK
jgi:hypothetical protein